MRTLVYAIAGSFLLYWAVAWALRLPPFVSAPGFYQNVDPKGQVYTCTAEGHPTFFVRFEEEGQAAIIRVDDQTVRLTFIGTDFFEELYRSGPWRLHLDPEANLYGPNGLHYGNCG